MKRTIRQVSLLALMLSSSLSLQGEKLPKVLFGKVNKAEMQHWVDSVYTSLSEEERIAQLIMPIIYPSSEESRITTEEVRLKRNKWGGILYQRGLLAEQATMNARLQRASTVPMLIALDGEWGLYMRLKDAPRYPRNLGLGVLDDEQELYNYGRKVAQQCRLMGIHVNFAPTVDVNINPRNPVIGSRSFGDDPKRVARLSLAYAQGLEDGNVLSVAKHFPGHGDTSEDSHKTLPLVSASRERMRSVELHPFASYIKEGFGGIMTGHLRVPAYDTSGLPSSLSHKITGKLLQEDMGFTGLIFTDGLEMQGVLVSKVSDIGVAALKAGNDILLGPSNAEMQLQSLIKASRNGELSAQLIEHKVKKVLAYKWRLILQPKDQPAPATEVYNRIWTEETQKHMRSLWRNSLYYYQRSEGLENALKAGKYKRIAIIQIGKNPIAAPPRPQQGLGGSKLSYLSWESIQKNPKQIENYDLILINAFSTEVPLERLVTWAKDRPLILAYYSTPYKVKKSPQHSKLSYVLLTIEAAREAQEAVLSLLTSDKESAPSLYPAQLPSNLPESDSSDPTAEMTPRQEQVSSVSKLRTEAFPLAILGSDKGFRLLDKLIEEGLKAGAFPGCQVYVWHKGRAVYNKAFGVQTTQLENQPVTLSTLYDVASITKALAMTPAVMLLVGDGKLKLNSPISSYLPELADSPIGKATIRTLLLHQSGLPAGTNFYTDLIDSTSLGGKPLLAYLPESGYIPLHGKAWGNPQFRFLDEYISTKPTEQHSWTMARGLYINPQFRTKMIERIASLPLTKIGQYRYTDLGFILLQQVVERISGEALDKLLDRRLFQPIDAKIYYNPLNHGIPLQDIAPAQNDRFLRKQIIRGTVDDESAACLGGVSGNAGLFASASELGKLAQLLLQEGRWQGKQLIPRDVVRQFFTTTGLRGRRALGFEKPRRGHAHNAAAESASNASVGHYGFTGTAFWIDPTEDLIFVFLSNRTYPSRRNGLLSSERYRPRLHQATYDALSSW